MTVRVRRATKDDLHGVCRLLARSTLNARSIPLEDRRRMFERIWGGTEDYCGYVLDDGGVVGFLGLLFTVRQVGGVARKFCELHSWYVDEKYRDQSIGLFMPVLSMRDVTLLNYTPTKPVYDISVKFGFTDLESSILLVYPVPSPAAFAGRFELVRDLHEVSALVSGEDKLIFNDHADLRCAHQSSDPVAPRMRGPISFRGVARMVKRQSA